MVYKPCYFYPSEYKKTMKQQEYIIKSLDFKKRKAKFMKNTSNYIYGIDHSILYTHNEYFFDENNERFDTTKL